MDEMISFRNISVLMKGRVTFRLLGQMIIILFIEAFYDNKQWQTYDEKINGP